MAKICNESDNVPKSKNSHENNFLVQGLMKFTGPNKMATVEITKALDVEGKFVIETSKERKVEPPFSFPGSSCVNDGENVGRVGVRQFVQ